MATIDPAQDYDFISTLTFDVASGTCKIRLYRGSSSAFAGTVYYRNGTSGSWTTLSVSGTGTTFPVGDTTMQVANDWNKSGDDYMTQSFNSQSTNLTEIAISQKAVLSGVIGSHFMYAYANICSSLTSLSVPNTSSVTSVGDRFMYVYANSCSALTSLSIPDTSSVTSVGSEFMVFYANDCSALTRLELPAIGWFASNNVDWSVPAGRLDNIKGYVKNSTDLTAWQGEVSTGETLYTNYIRSTSDVVLEPDYNPAFAQRRLLI